MTLYIVTTGLTAVLFFLVGFFVYLQNPKSELYLRCFVFSNSVALWALGYFITLIQVFNYDYTLLISRASHACGAIIPIAYYHFVMALLKKPGNPKFLKLGYLISIAMSVMSFSPWVVKALLPKMDIQLYPEWGVLYPLYTSLFVVYPGYAHYRMLPEIKRLHGTERTRLIYFFVALALAFAGGISLFFLIFNVPFPPYFSVFIILYPPMMAYTILVHKFMDIEVIVRRTAVFAGLFAFVYGVFTTVTILGQEFFMNFLGWNQWTAMIPTVFIITFSLRPLEIFLTNTTEKFLFQKKYDYRELLRTFTNETLTVLDLQKLMDQTVAGLIKIMKLEAAAVLLFDKDEKKYKFMAGSGIKDKQIVFDDSDTVIAYLKKTHQPIAKDKAADKIEGNSLLKDNFAKLNARLCLPITLHEELIGVLCLGMKKSGEDYTQEDIDILTTLARTEAIAISNAQLFDELSKTQAEAAQREKMAVIGTLAAGINHEICNPLGIVRGQCEMFLLNFRDGFYKSKSQDEVLAIASDVMGKVIKETDRATAITKKLSSFAKPSKRSEFEEVHVDKEVDEVLGLVGHDLQLNNIAVSKNFTENFPAILADRKQVQEVLFNIIRNAAQAMDKKAGTIQVSGAVQTEMAVIRIADNGSGIPKDKLEQVFHPFYTTKEPGKGTGLGLFIVKQVVERNKGSIQVESEQGVGTTFTLKFPLTEKMAAVA